MAATVYGQDEAFVIPDSLKGKTYSYLYSQQKKQLSDTISSKIYLNTFLTKATKENDTKNKALALNELSYYAENKEDKLQLIRRSLSESNSIDSLYSIPTYNTLGLYYKSYYNYEKALDQFLKVVKLSQKHNDKIYEGIGLKNIAKIKTEIGNYKEASILYKKGFDLENQQDDISEETLVATSLELAESYRYNKNTIQLLIIIIQ